MSDADARGLVEQMRTAPTKQFAEEIRGRLVLAHMGLIRFLVQRAMLRGLRMTADEALSEGYTKFLETAHRFRGDGGAKFATFMAMIVEQHLITLGLKLDRPRHRLVRSVDPAILEDTVTTPVEEPRWTGAARRWNSVEAAMSKLRPRQQRILQDFYGLSDSPRTEGAVVAQSLGMSWGALRAVKFRTIEQLAGTIRVRDFD